MPRRSWGSRSYFFAVEAVGFVGGVGFVGSVGFDSEELVNGCEGSDGGASSLTVVLVLASPDSVGEAVVVSVLSALEENRASNTDELTFGTSSVFVSEEGIGGVGVGSTIGSGSCTEGTLEPVSFGTGAVSGLLNSKPMTRFEVLGSNSWKGFICRGT